MIEWFQKPGVIDGIIGNLLASAIWGFGGYLLVHKRESIRKLTALLVKAIFTFIRNQWAKHGTRLKKLNWRQISLVLVYITLAIAIFYAGLRAKRHFSEKHRQEEVRKAEQTRAKEEQETAEKEAERIKEEEWQQHSRDSSNGPLSYQIVYTSRIWIPCLLLLALVYALANSSYIFIAIGKTIILIVFLVSSALLVARYSPELSEWQISKQFSDIVSAIAKEIEVPVTPVTWLGTAIATGILLETCARNGRRQNLTVKVEKA